MTDFTTYIKENAREGVRVEIRDPRSDDGAVAYCPLCGTACRVVRAAIDKPVEAECSKCRAVFEVAPAAYTPPEVDAWVMEIEAATIAQCQELGRLAGGIGIHGRFIRGSIAQAFYKTKKGIADDR